MPPDASVTVSAMFPVPDAAPQDEPADAAHVHVAPVSAAGSVSVVVAPVTAEGPLFVAITV